MIIKTKRVKDPFARILNVTLCDKRLSYRARGILAYLLSKPHDWQVVSEDIVNNGREGRDAIRACFKELKKFGYAKLVPNPTGGSMWIICEDDGTESLKNGISEKSREPEKADALKNRHYKDGKEGTKKDPQTPKGASLKDLRKIKAGKQTDERAIRVGSCIGRQPSTEWDKAEVKLFRDVLKREGFDDELAMVERFYAANRKKADAFCRTSIERLLKHWGGEVDKARSWCEKHPLKGARKVTAPKVVDLGPEPPMPDMGAPENIAFAEKFERQFHRLPLGYERKGEKVVFTGNGAKDG